MKKDVGEREKSLIGETGGEGRCKESLVWQAVKVKVKVKVKGVGELKDCNWVNVERV